MDYFLDLLKKCNKIFNTKLIVTGTHLSKHHGYTIKEIKMTEIKYSKKYLF